jgi:hypothetical protein
MLRCCLLFAQPAVGGIDRLEQAGEARRLVDRPHAVESQDERRLA